MIPFQFGNRALSFTVHTVADLSFALSKYEPWKATSDENLTDACDFAAQRFFDENGDCPAITQMRDDRLRELQAGVLGR